MLIDEPFDVFAKDRVWPEHRYKLERCKQQVSVVGPLELPTPGHLDLRNFGEWLAGSADSEYEIQSAKSGPSLVITDQPLNVGNNLFSLPIGRIRAFGKYVFADVFRNRAISISILPIGFFAKWFIIDASEDVYSGSDQAIRHSTCA